MAVNISCSKSQATWHSFTVRDDLLLSGGGEGVPPLGGDLHDVVGELAASQVKSDHGVGSGDPHRRGHRGGRPYRII